MRRSLSNFPSSNSIIGRSISATFSTSSGRGRSSPFQFTTPNSNDDASPPQPNPPIGRGRGQPLSFSNTPPRISSNPPKHENPVPGQSEPPTPVLPTDIINILSGTGRGTKITNLPSAAPIDIKPKVVENRHIRPRPPPPQQTNDRPIRPNVANPNAANEPQLSQEEKVRKAIEILSRAGDVGENTREYVPRDNNNNNNMRESNNTHGQVERGGRDYNNMRESNTRGQVERGGRGGGRGRGTGRGRGRERVLSRGDRERDEDEDDVDTGDEIDTEDDEEDFYIGDDAEGEKMAQKVGPDVMDKLVEGFDEAFDRVLPNPEDDKYKDALETNLMLECDPEYFMGEFGVNPDIDDKPIIPLRDALEKMKPFLMAYEGIQSHEEWEAVIEETMKSVPLMEKIVDDYGGPDRATAKQQQAELIRVANTLPTSAPDSVRHFTERAVLSLQSNPGWGFDKKCQYMDKLVMEVSKQYKEGKYVYRIHVSEPAVFLKPKVDGDG